MNIVWIVLGFIGGVIVARNAEPMNAPSVAAAVAAMVAGCAVAWTAAYHGKRQAVATAVANAVASATAQARSDAAAQAVLNIYGMDSPERALVPTQTVADNHYVTAQHTQGEIHHGSSGATARNLEHRRGLSLRPLRRRRQPTRLLGSNE